MIVYIASPFFNEEQLALVKSIEYALESAGIDYYSPRSEGVLLDLTEEERQANKTRIYECNIENIENCTHMLAVIDGRDIGTIWEMGYATAIGRPIVTLSNHDYGLNVMIAESVQAHTLSIEHSISCLLNSKDKGVLVTGLY